MTFTEIMFNNHKQFSPFLEFLYELIGARFLFLLIEYKLD